jgi:hypothetical protein
MFFVSRTVPAATVGLLLSLGLSNLIYKWIRAHRAWPSILKSAASGVSSPFLLPSVQALFVITEADRLASSQLSGIFCGGKGRICWSRVLSLLQDSVDDATGELEASRMARGAATMRKIAVHVCSADSLHSEGAEELPVRAAHARQLLLSRLEAGCVDDAAGASAVTEEVREATTMLSATLLLLAELENTISQAHAVTRPATAAATAATTTTATASSAASSTTSTATTATAVAASAAVAKKAAKKASKATSKTKDKLADPCVMRVLGDGMVLLLRVLIGPLSGICVRNLAWVCRDAFACASQPHPSPHQHPHPHPSPHTTVRSRGSTGISLRPT